MPSRQPRRPSIGLASCSAVARSLATSSTARAQRLGQRCDLVLAPWGGTRAAADRAAGCVTGYPSIARKIASKSPRCIGSSLASAVLRPSVSCARIISRMAMSRSPSKNMCSVRQRPMPSAPKSRPRCASAGVSALTRTRSWRILSAHCMSRLKLPDQLGRHERSPGPRSTRPLPPSTVIQSPCCERAAVHRELPALPRPPRAPGRRRRRACPCRAPRRPRATSCRPARSESPWRRPCRGSPRAGLPPHQDHRLALAAQLLGQVGVEHRGAAMRRRVRRGGRSSAGRDAALRIDRGVQQLIEIVGRNPGDRFVLGDQHLRPPSRRRCAPRPARSAGPAGSAACRACRARW